MENSTKTVIGLDITPTPLKNCQHIAQCPSVIPFSLLPTLMLTMPVIQSPAALSPVLSYLSIIHQLFGFRNANVQSRLLHLAPMIAARIAVDLLVEMRYKLRCLGINVERRSVLLGDNLSVVVNTTLPSSKIKKKHLSCSIARIREAVAAGFVRFGHIRSELNVSDIATKPLGPLAFHRIAHPFLFRHLSRNSDKNATDILHHPSVYRHYHSSVPTQEKKRIHSPTNPNLIPATEPVPHDHAAAAHVSTT